MNSTTSTRFFLLAGLLFLLAIVMIGILISTTRAPINIPDLGKAFNANGPLPIHGSQNNMGAAPFSLGDRDPHYTPEPTLTTRLSGGGR